MLSQQDNSYTTETRLARRKGPHNINKYLEYD